MAARVQLILGPAGSGKTSQLWEHCRTVSRADADSVLWLGPTRRHIEVLRQRTGPEARLLTFQQFADELVRMNLPASQPLATVQARLILDAILAEMNGRSQVRHFGRVAETRGFAGSLFALIGELKRQAIDPAHLARAALSVKDQDIARLYVRYQELLTTHQLFDIEGRIWQARDLLRQGQASPFDTVRFVFVDGFCDFSAPQQEILEHLGERVEELWLALADDGSAERAELFSRCRETVDRLRFAKRKLTPNPPPQGGRGQEQQPGLGHLEQQLFRPPRAVAISNNALGLKVLEAPGLLGEARMAAREIKTLLLDGVAAEDMIVAVRDVPGSAHLLHEVFTEYGIPVDVEGTEPLTRRPAVAVLLRALRLPDEDWPFAAVTALLRSTYFRPDWPETRADPEVAQHAEVLLRQIGEPRNREAYLTAVQRWAIDPPPGLEDEQAEESRRDRTHHLAVRCRAFLERFFHTWDHWPVREPLEQHLAWLHRVAAELGMSRTAEDNPADAAAWQRLEMETQQWLRLDRLLHTPPRPLTRKEFLRRLAILVAETGLAHAARSGACPHPVRGPGPHPGGAVPVRAGAG